MKLTSRLARPFKKRYDEYAGKVGVFVEPIKNALNSLRGKMPSLEGFAGSEELAGDADGLSRSGLVAGLSNRLKSFKASLKGMSDFQKLILLTIAVCLPAGILLSTILVGFLKNRQKQ